MRAIIRAVALIVLLSGLLAVQPIARAQTPVGLASLQIAFWPEFDRDGVLVLVDGALSPDTALPATVTFTLPVEPFAVAEQATDGSLVNAQYTTAPAGQAFAVTLTLQQPNFRVEYYDPALTRDGDVRSYAYSWQTPFSAGAVALRVQLPAGATDLKLGPEFGSPAPGEFGLSYYGQNLGAVAAGDTISTSFSYTKSGSALTVDQIDTGSTGSSAQPTVEVVSTTTPAPDYTPWLASAAVALVAILLIAIVWLRGRQEIEEPRSSHRRTRRAGRATVETTRPTAVGPAPRSEATGAPRQFCTQCGEPVAGDDRFCRRCGAPVKTS